MPRTGARHTRKGGSANDACDGIVFLLESWFRGAGSRRGDADD